MSPLQDPRYAVRSLARIGRVDGFAASPCRDDGLTDIEGEVMDDLVDAFNAYQDLPVQHEDEPGEFRYHVHMLQGLLAIRVARRSHPEGWATD